MITNAERDHLCALRTWSQKTRKSLNTAHGNPLLERFLSSIEKKTGTERTRVLDNVDWLIAVLERKADLQVKKRLRGDE